MLTLPGDPLFDYILNSCPPPGRKPDQFYFVVDVETGFLRTANQKQVDEYIWSGEYQQRLQDIDNTFDSMGVD